MAAGDWKDLLNAVQQGDLPLVRHHVENGVDVNYQHPELLITPLIASIEAAQHSVTKYLLEQGADPYLPAGFSTDTPFVVAKEYRNYEALALLKPYKKSPWQRIKALFSRNKN